MGKGLFKSQLIFNIIEIVIVKEFLTNIKTETRLPESCGDIHTAVLLHYFNGAPLSTLFL